MVIWSHINICKKKKKSKKETSVLNNPTMVDILWNKCSYSFSACELLLKWPGQKDPTDLKNAKYIYLYMYWVYFIIYKICLCILHHCMNTYGPID